MVVHFNLSAELSQRGGSCLSSSGSAVNTCGVRRRGRIPAHSEADLHASRRGASSSHISAPRSLPATIGGKRWPHGAGSLSLSIATAASCPAAARAGTRVFAGHRTGTVGLCRCAEDRKLGRLTLARTVRARYGLGTRKDDLLVAHPAIVAGIFIDRHA